MSIKEERLAAISHLIETEKIGNQEYLLKRLQAKGFSVTQATLSRDIKQLKIAKVPDGNEDYVYCIPEAGYSPQPQKRQAPQYPEIEFSGNLVVVKTRPGYAMGIASDIDAHAPDEILGTIAGDDTILVIPRDGCSRERIAAAIAQFMQ
jgi:transcriptional regulator of arginine metabolism